MDWQHPTHRKPKTVALVSLGPSRESYVAQALARDPDPLIVDCEEIWTVNRGALPVRHDLVWVMDNIQGEADAYPRYGAELWRHDRPIITSDNCSGWPSHVHAYPFAAIWDWLAREVRPSHGDWWHNSLAYIVTYAGWIGVQELRVWGADYQHHRSGKTEDGHANVAYWVGAMERVGLRVSVDADSTFLGASARDWIYGYREDPRPAATARRREFWRRALTGRIDRAKSPLDRVAGTPVAPEPPGGHLPPQAADACPPP